MCSSSDCGRRSSDSWCYVGIRKFELENFLLNYENRNYYRYYCSTMLYRLIYLDSSLSQSCLSRINSKKVKANIGSMSIDRSIVFFLVWISMHYKLLKHARAFHIFLMFWSYFYIKYWKKKQQAHCPFQVCKSSIHFHLTCLYLLI